MLLSKVFHKLLILIVVVSSCTSQEIDINVDPQIEEGLTFLALGDSYTIGQGVNEKSRWPIQLQTRLEATDKSISNVNIIAQTGWTTKDLLNAIDNQNPAKHDLVSLMIGVNNQFQKLNFELFKIEFDSLLNIANNLTIQNNRLFVVSIPDYGVTPFGSNNSAIIRQEIDSYNSYMLMKCLELKIPFVDITEISRELGDASIALATDKLHPSGYQYQLWVNEILPVVESLLD